MLPGLRAFARYLCGSRAEADDLVQEAVLRTLRALDNGLDPAGLKPFAFSVLRNTFHEHLRSRQREAAHRATLPEEPAEPGAQEAPARMRDLQRALAQLPPLLREALLLVGAQELSYAEAAAICGVPEGTMKARVSRARRQLAGSLGDVTA